MTLEDLVAKHGDALYEVLDTLGFSDKEEFSAEEVAQIEAKLSQPQQVEDAPKTKKVSKTKKAATLTKQEQRRTEKQGAIAASTKALATAAVQSGSKEGKQLGQIRNRSKVTAFLETTAAGDQEFLQSIAGMDDAISGLLDAGGEEILEGEALEGEEDEDFLLAPASGGFSIL